MAVPGHSRGGHAVGSYAGAAMSELRRSGGPDDADKPAADLPKAEQPGRPRGFEIRTADQNPDWPVDRRKVTAAQKYYHELIKRAGDVPPIRETGIVYVRDWASGGSLDDKYPPVTRDRGRTKPDKAPSDQSVIDALPDELKRDNSTLEAGTIQRTDSGEVEEVSSTADTGKRRRRSLVDKAFENAEDIQQELHDLTDKVGIFQRPPTHTAVGSVPPSGDLGAPIYSAHTPGDMVAALAAGAFVIIGAGRKMHDKLGEWKDRHGGNG